MSIQTLTIHWGISGLVGQISYGIILESGEVLVPSGTTQGITEVSSGEYQAQVSGDKSGIITWSFEGESYSQAFTQVVDSAPSHTYQTVAQIDAYASTKLNTGIWDSSTPSTKLKASYEATRIIDSLNYIYNKLDANQPFEFPRTHQTVIPKEILYAHSEIAIELINSDGSRQNSTNVLSEGFSSVRITYDPHSVPVWLRAGVPSEIAWNYLLQFLAPIDGVTLRRVS